MKAWQPLVLGMILGAALILISAWDRSARIAPAGVVGMPGGMGGYAAPNATRDPLAPPLAGGRTRRQGRGAASGR